MNVKCSFKKKGLGVLLSPTRVYLTQINYCYLFQIFIGESDNNLNACATAFLLVGDVEPDVRAKVFQELVKSKMITYFMDDVNRLVRQKLCQPR